MASRRDIIEETNARYWVSTGYKLGEALDPSDPTDRMHARRWLATYRDLLDQNARGTLTLLHNDPSFAQALRAAIDAYRSTRYLAANDPRYAEAVRMKNQALSDAALWQEMIASRSRSAVSGALVGLEGYGLPPRARSAGPHTSDAVRTTYRDIALQKARAIYAATNNPNIGYRDTPWGGELVAFDQLSAMERWKREQAADQDVWYAVTFRLDTYGQPVSELIR